MKVRLGHIEGLGIGEFDWLPAVEVPDELVVKWREAQSALADAEVLLIPFLGRNGV